MADAQVEPESEGWYQGLIRRGWGRFAAYAYSRFLAHGRGAVMLSPAPAVSRPPEERRPTSPVSVDYLTADLAATISPPDGGLLADLATYDPKTEVLFFVIYRDPSSYEVIRLEAGLYEVSPPAAHRLYTEAASTN